MIVHRKHIGISSPEVRGSFEARSMARAIAALFILVGVVSIAFVSHPAAPPVAPSVSEPLQVVPAAVAPADGAAPESAPVAAAPADATSQAEQAEQPAAEELQYVTYGG